MRLAGDLQGRLGINWTASKGQRNRTSLKTNIGWSETLREIIDEALAIKRNIDAPNEIVFGNLAGQRYTGSCQGSCRREGVNQAALSSGFGSFVACESGLR